MKYLVYFIVGLLLVGCGGSENSKDHEKELEELRELAELDRQEMEEEYRNQIMEYEELKKGIMDDSLLQRLNEEQQRAEQLEQQLRELKSNDAKEIKRLKKELETVRAVLRTYILQVDSLQRLNRTLVTERDEARAQVEQANSHVSSLETERANLTQKVAIAAQLDAINITLSPIKKNGKAAKKTKEIAQFAISFTIAKNVTAEAGTRSVYVRLLKPGQTLMNPTGVFTYENRTLECSAMKHIEYDGNPASVQMYVPVKEALTAGTYALAIFADGQMIGSTSITMEK